MSEEDDRKAHAAFASAALSGLCARVQYDELTDGQLEGAFLVADAMMVARARRNRAEVPPFNARDQVECDVASLARSDDGELAQHRPPPPPVWKNGIVVGSKKVEEHFTAEGVRVPAHYLVGLVIESPAFRENEIVSFRWPEDSKRLRPRRRAPALF